MALTPDAIVLAAGLGTRLRPVTDLMPKPLIPVAGQALIDHAIGNCRADGITRFVVNMHAHPGQMAAHVEALRRRHPDCRFRISDESARLLGTEGGVRAALKLCESDPVLVANADCFWPQGEDLPLPRLVAALDEATDIVLLCASPDRAIGFRGGADFRLAPGGRLTDATGDPVIHAGRALIRRRLFDAPPPGASLAAHFRAAKDAGRLKGVLLDADWLHVGDAPAIIAAEARLAGR